MSFFKKMMGLFREEIEIDEETEQRTDLQKNDEPLPENVEKQTRPYSIHERTPDAQEIQAKVAYQYPSREFRFPASQDLSPRPRRERRSVEQALDKSVVGRAEDEHMEEQEPVHENPIKAAPVYKPLPGPFRPTEIPSPVYGFKKRPLKEGNDLQEIEREEEIEVVPSPVIEKNQEPPQIIVEKEEEIEANYSPVTEKESEPQQIKVEKEEEVVIAPVDISEKEQTVQKPQKEEPLLLFKPEEKKKAFDVEAVPSFLEEEEQVEPEPAIETNPAAVPPLKEEAAVPIEVEEKPAPPTNPDGKLPKETGVSRAKERSRKRRQTPFNVIMSKQDREVWKKRKEEKPALVQQESPAAVLSAVDERASHIAPEPKSLPLQAEEPEALQQGTAFAAELEHYVFPRESYLSPPVFKETSREWVDAQSEVLNETFKNFNVKATVVNVTVGPSVTRFEVEPERGVKVSKITNLTDDIKRSLAARNIRIEAPIPGTQVIGIEVPNKESRPVQISEIISSPAFKENSSPLTSALGLDISGEPAVLDLKKMPHGLIAGATGSGKSVCINSILVSLLYKAAPHELKLLLIDPKMVELAPYNGIPHLVSPVITDVKAATAALKWAVEEMERRYELFVHSGVRDITKYNEKAETHGRKSEHLPYIVIIIDELADLMMMSPADVEEAICRIAQKARACGIHLIVATQRPSVDVITGLIKANIPTRIAFSVSSQVDSRTIIDTGGAEKLLGRGDMLLLNNGASETVRLQGTFVSDDEIDTVVEHARKEQEPNYLFQQEELLQKAQLLETEDELFPEACEFVVRQGGASTSLLQRHFKIGYNRAARLIEMMETQGLVSGQRAGKPREVLMTEEDLHALNETSTI
ncbi:DNA translocase FtsK [Bacillus aerolatus]|uniref:DNA translocase FtsK n=1 Tax=Bacillus aerolatus TaxID=2653354 RepID=A0A6I1FDP9_9BACI|nr:DNA translocase FtsK [Bacillus aerolatus]KAB7705872.1 DNA translocase FtsK [Bacillus aerolatus]